MRRHSLDWIRNLIILSLIPFHAARVFDSFEPFYIKNGYIGGIYDFIVLILSSWFMFLLFFIAGVASFYSSQKRDSLSYLKERFNKLLIPFIAGLLIIIPPQCYIASVSNGYKGTFIDFISSYFTKFTDFSGYDGGFTPAHLWFILFLFVISILLLPLMQKISKSNTNKLIDIISIPIIYILLCIPFSLINALPEIEGKNIFVCALYFMLGFIVSKNNVFFEKAKKYTLWEILLGFILLVSMCFLIFVWNFPTGINLKSSIVVLLRHSSNLLIIAGLIGLCERFLNKESKLNTFLNKYSFPIYIFHQTVLVILAYYVVKLSIPHLLQFIIMSIGTFLITILVSKICYEFKVTRCLLGLKKYNN